MKAGLCSITFRKLSRADVVGVAAEAGLSAIEWGGDIHVPHGDLSAALEAARLTRAAGLSVCSYGSYYRAGAANSVSFETVLETATALETRVIRIWGGEVGPEACESEIHRVADDARILADAAMARGMRIAFEFHGGTVADSGAGAHRLMDLIDHPAARCYWQPALDRSVAERLDDLREIMPWLENIHVFHWTGPGLVRLPLAEGEREWQAYLEAVAGREGYLLLEYVRDDSLEAFREDAAALKRLLGRRRRAAAKK